MITSKNREYAIGLLKLAISNLNGDDELFDEGAISYIASAYGELRDALEVK